MKYMIDLLHGSVEIHIHFFFYFFTSSFWNVHVGCPPRPLRSDKNVEGQFREFQKKRKGEFGRLRKVIVQNDSHEWQMTISIDYGIISVRYVDLENNI